MYVIKEVNGKLQLKLIEHLNVYVGANQKTSLDNMDKFHRRQDLVFLSGEYEFEYILNVP